MARYIDGEKLFEYYEERYKNLCKKNGETDAYCQGYNDAMYVAEHIDFAADVVPKSEYDAVVSAVDNSTKEFLKLHDDYQEAKRELEELTREKESLKDRYQVLPDGRIELLPRTDIEKIKTEVAREIFEDIDGKISCFFPASSFVNAPNTTHYQLLAMLAELKKKYTEEQS